MHIKWKSISARVCIEFLIMLVTYIIYTYRGSDSTSAVTELIEFSDSILTLQFRMATSCDGDSNSGRSLAILEVSKDDGSNWDQVSSDNFICQNH